MALSTYTELQSDMADWLERADLTARIPSFIKLTEASMNRLLRAEGATGRSTATVTTEFSALPTDFAEAKSLRILVPGTTTWETLSPMDDGVMSSFSGEASRPRRFAVVGTEVRFYPIPNDSFTVEMTYFSKVPALSSTNASNWVLASHPDAYLYGSLTHAAPFLRDSDMLPIWKGLYDTAVAGILLARSQPGGKLRTDPSASARRPGRSFNIQTGS